MRKQQFELFGHGSSQGEIFADAPEQTRGRILDFPAEARRRLTDALAKAKAAPGSPWSGREMSMWEILFPQMAGWLPEEEAQQLCFEFAREIERLKNAA